MLFTRCPDCHTTFRITNEVLHKADGQVRCGRCSNVFDAYADLRERPDTQKAADDGRAGTPIEAAAAPDLPVAEATDGDAASAAGEQTEPAAPAAPAWALESTAEAPSRGGLIFGLGAILGALALGAQALHHYRAALAGITTIGPAVQRVYALLGLPIAPVWDVEQFEVVDWVATAGSNTRGHDDLVIEARIHNRGPQAQPYPHVQLQLLDRFEAAIGRRVFHPDEYLVAPMPQDALMQAGDTAQAQLVVVDPGPDAYGFELDVCVEADGHMRCSADAVFR